MFKQYQKIIFILALLLLSSCVDRIKDLASYEQELKARNSFNGYLALEYLQYSRDLANKRRWQDSNYFAQKGLRAVEDQLTFPEYIEDWNLSNEEIEKATLGRQKLIEFLTNPKAMQIMKPQLAHLQLLYDCWVSKGDNPQQLSDMAKCKVLFFKLDDEMKKYLAERLKPKKEIKAAPLNIEPQFTKFEVYFDLDSRKFNSKADQTFADLFDYLTSLKGDYKILLIGTADRMGKTLYNDSLARDRALMVKTRLTKNGVPESLITIKSLGEDSPEIATIDGDTNKNNRQVAIYILKGRGEFSSIPLPLIENKIYQQEIIKTKKQRGFN